MVEEGAARLSSSRRCNAILRRRDIQTQRSRQGRAADGRRIHRAGALTRRRRLPGGARAARCSATGRRCRIPRRCSPIPRREGARRRGAAAPAGLLHRLPGAADLRGHEARREGARPAPRLGRHRLPSLLDPAALQHRRDDDGLRPRPGLGLGLQRRRRTSGRSR